MHTVLQYFYMFRHTCAIHREFINQISNLLKLHFTTLHYITSVIFIIYSIRQLNSKRKVVNDMYKQITLKSIRYIYILIFTVNIK
jgi:hypothetical protein